MPTNKKIIFISLILLVFSIFVISNVSATEYDNNTNLQNIEDIEIYEENIENQNINMDDLLENQTLDNNEVVDNTLDVKSTGNLMLFATNNDLIEEEEFDIELKANYNGNTFTGLADAITALAPGDEEIILGSDISASSSNPPITINKNLIINGMGHTINGNSIPKMFLIINNVNVTFINLTFMNAVGSNDGTNKAYGSVILIENANQVLIINSTFLNNRANYGGAIFGYANNLTIINSNFNNNFARYNGGAICIQEYGIMHSPGKLGIINIFDSTFDNNDANHAATGTAGGAGGAIYYQLENQGSKLFVNNSNFTNNYANFTGGAIYSNVTNMNLTITNSYFENNVGRNGGAVSIQQGEYTLIKDSKFIENKAYKITTHDDGGAIFNRVHNAIIMNSLFERNSVPNAGGAIYNLGNYVTLNNLTIFNNSAIYGGAIANEGNNFTLIDSNISSNYATNNIIFNTASGINFKILGSNTIENNTVTSNRGVINNLANNFLIDGKNKIDNNYNGGSYSAIYNTGNNFKINGTNSISNNKRGIYNNASSFTISGNNTISNNNKMSGGENGAGIYNAATGINFKIIGSNIIANNIIPQTGAGIYNLANIFTITGSNIIANNSANQNGGGIYNTGGNYFLIIGNNTITNNSANQNGGGIYNYNGNYFIISGNNEITFNDALSSSSNGGGIYNGGTGVNFTITGSNIIANNTAGSQGAGIWNSAINFLINDSNIIANNIIIANNNGLGAGIFNSANNFRIINNNSIINNIINASSQAVGGGIYNSAANFLISGDSNNISNNILYSISSSSYGAGIYNIGTNFRILGNVFITNNKITSFSTSTESEAYGGGIFNSANGFLINGTNNIISDNSINSASSKSKGGGIFNSAYNSIILGTITIANNIVHSNTTSNVADESNVAGGGIYNSGSHFTIDGTNIIIANNSVTALNTVAHGGGIYNYRVQYFLINGTNNIIANNTAKTNGGGIYNINGNFFTISGTNIIFNNTATNGGGIYNVAFSPGENDIGEWQFIQLSNNFTIIGNNQIINNTALSDGGGIYNNGLLRYDVLSAGYFTINGNNLIAYNNAGNNGGGIYNLYGYNFTIIKNNTISYNNAINGSGIYNDVGFNFQIIENNTLKNNIASENGGGIYNNGGLAIIGSNLMYDNKATLDGGALYYSFDNRFINNFIEQKDYVNGILDYENYEYEMHNYISGNNYLYNNTARNGGAIWTNTSILLNKTNKIFNNTATQNGGGIYNIAQGFTNNTVGNINDQSDIITIFLTAIIQGLELVGNNEIYNNNAINGGGIWTNASIFLNETNKIFNNIATQNGGGIYNTANAETNNTINKWNDSDRNYTVSITISTNTLKIIGNNEIYNNSAILGGGLYNEGNKTTIQGNNKLHDNEATNGGAIYNLGINFTLNGTNHLYNNTAFENGGAIYNSYLGTFYSEGNRFINNSALNGTAIYNAYNMTVLNGFFEDAFTDNNHFIYNAPTGTLYLDNNVMKADHIEKIYNLGQITSEIMVYYINNKTITANIGQIIPLNVTLTDDNNNTIVGQKVTIYVNNSSLVDEIELFNNGYYNYINFISSKIGTYIINGTTYAGGSNLTRKYGIITLRGIDSYLVINKTVNTTEANTGDYIEYNITIKNNHTTLNATNVTILDYLPNGLDFNNSKFNGFDWEYDENTRTWILKTLLAPGETVVLTLIFRVSGGYDGVTNNTANVTYEENPDGENVTSPNTNITDVVLNVSKFVDLPFVHKGDIFNYTITIKNIGSSIANDVTIIDYIPVGLTYYRYQNGTGLWNQISETSWKLSSDLGVGQEVTLILFFNVTGFPGSTVVNIINVTTNQTPNGNNTTSNELYIADHALDVIKSTNVTHVKVGDYVYYNITIINGGADDLNNVTVIEYIPDGLEYVRYENTTGYWNKINNYTWVLNETLYNENEVILTLVFRVVGTIGQNITNIVNVTTDEFPEGENYTSNNFTVTNAILNVDKIGGSTIAVIGDRIYYNITISNTGTANATGVVVKELIPFGLTYDGYDGYGRIWTYNAVDSTWTLNGDLGNKSSITLTLYFIVNVNASGILDNTVIVWSNETGGNSSNDTNDTDNETYIKNASLTIVKEAGSTVANYNDTIYYDITIRNIGVDDATGVIVKELIPKGLTYLRYESTMNWEYNNVTDTWTLEGSIANNTSIVLRLFFRVNGNATGIMNNTVIVWSNETGGNNTNETNDTDNETNVTNVNLSVVKVANNDYAIIGQMISYDIVIYNHGTSTATDVVVSEYIPIGLEYDHYENVTGGWTESNGKWVLNGTLAGAGANVTIRLFFRVNESAVGYLENIVNIKTNQTGGNESNGTNATNNETEVVNATLIVNKIGGSTIAVIGDRIYYNITITNNAQINATGVVVKELIPFGLTYDGYDGYGRIWTYNAVDSTWTLNGDLGNKSSITLTLYFIVNVNASGILDNTVIVWSNETGGNSSNDTNDTDNETYIKNASLTIVKEAGSTVANYNDTIYYDITIRNIGVDDATGVIVKELIPKGLTYLRYESTMNWEYNNVTDTWTLEGSIANNTSIVLRLFFRVNGNATGIMNNTVIVWSNETGGNNTNETNDTDNETNVTNVNLSVVKVANNDYAIIGQMISYDIVIYNHGTSTATDVVVSEYIPIGLEYDHYENVTGGWTESNGKWVLNGTLAGAGANVTIRLFFRVNESAVGYLENIVNIKTNQTGGNESNGTNATNNETEVVNATLIVNKIGGSTIAVIGDRIYYNITITNNAQINATGVVVKELIPFGLTYDGYDGYGRIWTYNAVDSTWTLNGDLGNKSSITLTLYFIVNVNASGILDNTVIVWSNETGGNSSNDTNDTDNETYIKNASLTIVKEAGSTVANYNDTIYYDITIRNIGVDDATGVIVKELIPKGLTYLRYESTMNWEYNNVTDTWTLEGSIANNTSIVLRLFFRVNGNATGIMNNTVIVWSNETGGNNTNETNDTDNETNVTNVNLSVVKVANNDYAIIGQMISYDIVIYNHGTSTATDVVVSEYIPIGLEYDHYENVTGGWTESNGKWVLNGTLAGAGANVTIRLFFRVNESAVGYLENIVNIKTNQTGGNESNGTNATNNETEVVNATLIVNKIGGSTIAVIGDRIYYNITITNNAQINATGVVVKELIPFGLTYDGYDGYGRIWTYNAVDSTWTLNGDLGNKSSITLTLYFIVNVNASGILDNTVIVWSNETGGNSSNDTNDTDNETYIKNASLTIVKEAGSTVANYNDTIYYDITIRNIGVDDATGVIVKELIPKGLTYLRYESTMNWEYNNVTDTWTLEGSIANNTSIVLRLFFRVNGNATGIMNNTVIVWSNETGGNNTNETNDTDNETNVTNVNLIINKLVNKNSANIGENVTYTITIENIGTSDATNVVIHDLTPYGLDLIDDGTSSGLWTYYPNSDIWVLNSSLASNAKVTLILVFNVTGEFAGIVNNTITVGSNQTNDTNITSNNTNLTNVTLDIHKIAGATVININEIIYYDIIIFNTGSTPANDIIVREYIPEGLNYLYYENIYGNWIEANANTWYLNGTINGGHNATIRLFFKVTMNATGFINNTVNVWSNQTNGTDPNGTNVTNNTTNIRNVSFNISKIAGSNIANIGDIIFYDIVIVNTGSDNATDVVLKEYIPNGLSYLNYDNIYGSWREISDNIWLLNGYIAPGANATIRLFFTVNGNVTGFINNTVNVKSNQTGGNESEGENSTNNTTNVYKLNTITEIDDVSGKPGETVTINGIVIDENGNPVISGNVTIILPDGSNVIVNVENGTFTYDWTIPNSFKPGIYDIVAYYNGNDKYEPSENQSKAYILKLNTVTSVDDITGKPGEGVIITGTVVDENGNLVKNGTVILTLPDGSKVSVPVIDGHFEYPWTIPNNFKEGSYIIIADFIGNEYYESSIGNGTLTVLTSSITPPVPGPGIVEDKEDIVDKNVMEKTGNPIIILLLVLISSLILLPLKRRF
ncbi:hypothetical protein [Methanobrevibacter sp. DSM 116169]|uniref:hypothetical protein n=1 Tax=Methanobrevibacter sp. DSM 116169 TaxID=3242727 RepID=UPI0038FCF76C